MERMRGGSCLLIVYTRCFNWIASGWYTISPEDERNSHGVEQALSPDPCTIYPRDVAKNEQRRAHTLVSNQTLLSITYICWFYSECVLFEDVLKAKVSGGSIDKPSSQARSLWSDFTIAAWNDEPWNRRRRRRNQCHSATCARIVDWLLPALCLDGNLWFYELWEIFFICTCTCT